MKLYIILPLVAVLGPFCLGYPMFQDRIPNGNMVPQPCKPNHLWKGVGHINPGGGGPRNPFGLDFHRNGKVWDECLCNYDSDGDGKTNGEELGDPKCVWKEGMAPEITLGLSHPGICEPIDSPLCLIKNIDLGDFCDKVDEINPCIEDVKKQDAVKSLRISFPETPVPAQETTYVCQTFALPNDTDYHVIASEPYITNPHVMHHVLVYGCKDTAVVTDRPAECEMAACTDVIATWSVGYNGNCMDEAFGFRIGKTGYKKVLMQAHWNNPELRPNYTDSSGMVLYYTPNLRPNDGGVMMVGQGFLVIPPGQVDYSTSGVCTSGCTTGLPQKIFIAEAWIHMHYLGSKGYIEHYRNDTKVTDLVDLDVYSYDTPVTFYYDPPVEFHPGDSIKTICHFKSTSRSKTTYYGDGTNEEMCYGFLTYYPKMPLAECVAYANAPACPGATAEDQLIDGCNFTACAVTCQPFYEQLYTECDVTGASCKPSCKTLLSDWSAKEPCFRGDAVELLKAFVTVYAPDYADAIITMMESCDEKKNSTPKKEGRVREPTDQPLCPEENNGNTEKPTNSGCTAAASLVGIGVALILAVPGGL